MCREDGRRAAVKRCAASRMGRASGKRLVPDVRGGDVMIIEMLCSEC